jgi:hypothetical protein
LMLVPAVPAPATAGTRSTTTLWTVALARMRFRVSSCWVKLAGRGPIGLLRVHGLVGASNGLPWAQSNRTLGLLVGDPIPSSDIPLETAPDTAQNPKPRFLPRALELLISRLEILTSGARHSHLKF